MLRLANSLLASLSIVHLALLSGTDYSNYICNACIVLHILHKEATCHVAKTQVVLQSAKSSLRKHSVESPQCSITTNYPSSVGQPHAMMSLSFFLSFFLSFLSSCQLIPADDVVFSLWPSTVS